MVAEAREVAEGTCVAWHVDSAGRCVPPRTQRVRVLRRYPTLDLLGSKLFLLAKCRTLFAMDPGGPRHVGVSQLGFLLSDRREAVYFSR